MPLRLPLLIDQDSSLAKDKLTLLGDIQSLNLHPDRELNRPDSAHSRTSGSKLLGSRLQARAKRISEERDAGEWAALAYDDAQEDPEVLQSVTEVCNKGLRLMLRGDTFRLEPFKEELSKWGQHFADKGNMQGAVFIYAVYQLAEHRLPKEYEKMQGQYLEAYTKMFDILEDSGWRIKMEGEEEDDDDKDLLPDQSAGYFQNAGL